MTSLFSNANSSVTAPQVPAAKLRVQTSVQGIARPIVYGKTRIAGNLIWYGDFRSAPGPKAGSGGKSGGKGGAPKPGTTGSFVYFSTIIMGLCEGPIIDVPFVWDSSGSSTSPTPVGSGLNALGLDFIGGAYTQNPWDYMTSVHPDQSLAYRGLATIVGFPSLGTTPNLPSWNFLVFGIIFPGQPLTSDGDVDPSLVTIDFLTNPHYGVGFPSDLLGSFFDYQNMTIASQLMISWAVTEQQAANTQLKNLMEATNAEFVWSSGKLSVVPYGDLGATSAFGWNYAPNTTLEFSLGDDDFLPNQGGSSLGSGLLSNDDPIQCTRKRQSDVLNIVRVEFTDRSNDYNPAVIEAMDDGSIQDFGIRKSDLKQTHFFHSTAVAQISATAQLLRERVLNQYSFTLDQRYIVLDPMDKVALTDLGLGLIQAPVLIKEITENSDGSLVFIAEDYLGGVSDSPVYGFQVNTGFNHALNAAAVNTNAPMIFEPPIKLARSPEVWVEVSGPTGAGWGGCDVWVSNDGASYRFEARIEGGAKQGALLSGLPAPLNLAIRGPIDFTFTVRVDISGSQNNVMLSGTTLDALNANTLCYVGGEFFSYTTATLISTGVYDLSGLVRGQYGSTPVTHRAGEGFVRLDMGGLVRWPIESSRIGQLVYFKFLSFNAYEGGLQQLSDVFYYSYRITGSAFHSPPADITTLTSVYNGIYAFLSWIEIVDDRTIRYDIRKGSSWQGAQRIATVAHPPFQIQGDDLYWVTPYATTIDGLIIYASSPQSLELTGSVLTTNIIKSFDEGALGWLGTLGGSGILYDPPGASAPVVETSSGDVLSEADWLSTLNILNFGDQFNATYEIPTSHEVDIGYISVCPIIITYVGIGQIYGQNILAEPDLLGVTDLLDSASSDRVTVFPELSVSQDLITWGPWQRYQVGSYSGRGFKARMQLQSNDPQTQAILESFVFTVDVPSRIDHFLSLGIIASGTSIVFRPDEQPAAPFNGGPSNSGLPIWRVSILDAVSGDTLVVSALTLSGATITIFNSAGIGVGRVINAEFEGY